MYVICLILRALFADRFYDSYTSLVKIYFALIALFLDGNLLICEKKFFVKIQK